MSEKYSDSILTPQPTGLSAAAASSAEMEERVARAICVQNLVSTRQPTDDDTVNEYWRSFLLEARAALFEIGKTHWLSPVPNLNAAARSAAEKPGFEGVHKKDLP